VDADERIDFAQREATEAGLTSAIEVADVQAFVLGATLTHFDETPTVPMTDARWRRIVRAGIAHVRDDS